MCCICNLTSLQTISRKAVPFIYSVALQSNRPQISKIFYFKIGFTAHIRCYTVKLQHRYQQILSFKYGTIFDILKILLNYKSTEQDFKTVARICDITSSPTFSKSRLLVTVRVIFVIIHKLVVVAQHAQKQKAVKQGKTCANPVEHEGPVICLFCILWHHRRHHCPTSQRGVV